MHSLINKVITYLDFAIFNGNFPAYKSYIFFSHIFALQKINMYFLTLIAT